jgi:hypothetical protein
LSSNDTVRELHRNRLPGLHLGGTRHWRFTGITNDREAAPQGLLLPLPCNLAHKGFASTPAILNRLPGALRHRCERGVGRRPHTHGVAAGALDNEVCAGPGLAPCLRHGLDRALPNSRDAVLHEVRALWTPSPAACDETSNGAHVDLAKLQMFFFTLSIALSYCAALWRTFKYAQADGISVFPVLDQSTIALLGISHSGYLLNKAVPRS